MRAHVCACVCVWRVKVNPTFIKTKMNNQRE